MTSPCISLLILGLILFISLPQINGELCPDQKVRCPKTSTCCSDLKGSYGCCPYPNATCCNDGSHCCPHNTECDTEHSRCIPKPSEPEVKGWRIVYNSDSAEDSQSEQVLLAGNELGNGSNNVTGLLKKKCPDGDRSCPDSYTCCPLASGGFGCCPFTDGICCQDHVHCCAKGQTCNLAKGSCD